MDLLQGDGDADTGQHGVDHHGSHGEGGARDPAEPEQDLQHARGDHDETGDAPTELRDGLGDDHGQTRGGSADLQDRPTEQTGHHTTDHGGDETGGDRRAGGHRDAERQGQRDQENYDRSG